MLPEQSSTFIKVRPPASSDAAGNGTYVGATGDNGESLPSTNGSYTLTELDGTVTNFLPTAVNNSYPLNYIQDSNGNRITAHYTGTLLTSLTHSNGDQLTIGYNAQGLISQVTDPAGNVTTYGYDSNQQLISVANAQGTYRYTYINGQGLRRNMPFL